MVEDDDAAYEEGFYAQQNAKRKQVRAGCVKRGIHWARSCVGTQSDGEVAQYMIEWIDEVEEQDAKISRRTGICSNQTWRRRRREIGAIRRRNWRTVRKSA